MRAKRHWAEFIAVIICFIRSECFDNVLFALGGLGKIYGGGAIDRAGEIFRGTALRSARFCECGGNAIIVTIARAFINFYQRVSA